MLIGSQDSTDIHCASPASKTAHCHPLAMVNDERSEALLPNDSSSYMELEAQAHNEDRPRTPHRRPTATIIASVALGAAVTALVVAVVGYNTNDSPTVNVNVPSTTSSKGTTSSPGFATTADYQVLLRAATSLIVLSSGGMHPRECLHSVPHGTKLLEFDGGVIATFPDGTKRTFPPCSVKPPPRNTTSSRQRRSFGGHSYPVNWWANPHGQMDAALYSGFDSFTAQYTVPAKPSQLSGQTVYIWIGSEDQGMDYVIQPVLGIGSRANNGAGGSSDWSVASWNCCPAGHKFASTGFTVQPGDQVSGAMTRQSDGSYDITTTANGRSTTINADNTWPPISYMYTVETYNVNDCAEMPPSGDWIHSGEMSPNVPSSDFQNKVSNGYLTDCPGGGGSSITTGAAGVDVRT